MNSSAISLLVFFILFGGALAGMAIRSALSERHRDADSKETVKVAMGLIATLSALVLGLVIASAKSSYDEQFSQVRQLTARVIYLDQLLVQYGSDTLQARKSLRQAVEQAVGHIWRESVSGQKVFKSTDAASTLVTEIESLSAQNDSQRSLQARAIQAIGEIAQTRLLLFARSGTSIPIPFVLVLIFWLTTLFTSFTLFSHTNAIAIVALLVSALSVAGAIFLILELDQPFSGLLRIPESLPLNALPALAP